MAEKKEKIIYVIGHKNPDTDSICSAMASADLKNKISARQVADEHADRVVYKAVRAGHLNQETRYVMKAFDVTAPTYMRDARTQIKDIFDVCVETIRTFAPILFILATSVAFSRVLTLMQVPQIVSEWILTNFSNKIIILLVINLVLLAVGMVMDTTPAILILTPILLPIVTAIGVNPIQFGVIMIVNLAIGFITPPIGINLFVASSLTDVPVMDIAKKSIPMIICFLIALLLFTFIPSISLMPL